MAVFLARKGTAAQTVADDYMPQIVSLLNDGYTFYRIQPVGDGTFTLIPQRPLDPVTEQRVVSTDFEDDV